MFWGVVADAFDQNYNFCPFSNMFDGFHLFISHWFLSIKNVLIQSIFGLDKCSIHEKGVEFYQELIGNAYKAKLKPD